MPQPLPLPIRQQIWERFQDGQAAATSADALRLPRRTVQHVLQRYRLRGQAAVQPDYHAPPPRPATVDAGLQEEALFLRPEHSTWGAGFRRVRLQDRHPDVDLPSEYTVATVVSSGYAGRRSTRSPVRPRTPDRSEAPCRLAG